MRKNIVSLSLLLTVAGCASTTGVRVATTESMPLGSERLDVTIGLRRDPGLTSLVADISPALRKRLSGDALFALKPGDDGLLPELERLVAAAYDAYDGGSA